MRNLHYGLVMTILATGPVAAQSALEGPLSAPDSLVASPAPPAKKAAHKKPKAAKTAKAKLPPYSEGEAARPAETQSIAHAPSVGDPVSFGMKWNGSNDDARNTRVQNYGGDAAGNGAEVGMKLHF